MYRASGRESWNLSDLPPTNRHTHLPPVLRWVDSTEIFFPRSLNALIRAAFFCVDLLEKGCDDIELILFTIGCWANNVMLVTYALYNQKLT